MTNSLIIARYSEDLNWLSSYKDFKIIIYNKGKKISNKEFNKIENIENVGRESHTWLYHIVNNYHTLDNVSIFLQGRIDDLGCMAYQDPNIYLKYIDKIGFVASRYGMLSPFHWKRNIGIEKNKKYKKEWESGAISKSKIGFRKFAINLFPEIPIFVSTSYGGCFAVKKDLIKQYDLEFYSKLLNILSKHKNPIEGHYMERLWCYMFTRNMYFYRSIKDVLQTKFEKHLLKF